MRYLRARLRWDWEGTIDTLNDLFRRGTVPAPPLDGFYRGQLLTLAITPGLDRLGNGLVRKWMPWRGKRFEAANNRGDNVFSPDARLWLKLRWPTYGGFIDDPAPIYGVRNALRAFAFRTGIGPGVQTEDAGMSVLKIDYDLPDNPAAIRLVVDELVELSQGFYLGKAQYHAITRWRTAAFFSLIA